MIQVSATFINKLQFDRTLKEYVKLNRRATSGLVEHTAKKVVTGFSPRSPSRKRVKGLRQFYYEKRATATKIKAEAKQRSAQGRGTLRPPRNAVSKKAQNLTRSWGAAINWRSKRGTSWLQATMLYKQWRPSFIPKNKNLKPSLDNKHKGTGQPNTKTIIRTKGSNPFVVWRSKVPGVLKNKHRHKAIRSALREARLDMKEYIRMAHQKIKMGKR
jgi:uncharacterized membrane protein